MNILTKQGRTFVTKQIGDIVRLARYTKGWTQEQLAEETGLTKLSIIYVERGRALPKLDTLYALCMALELEWTEVLPDIKTTTEENQRDNRDWSENWLT